MSSSTHKPNEAILLAEDGFVRKIEDDWKFRWAWFFKHSENKYRNRPKVDVSAPYNPTDETHMNRVYGETFGLMGMSSLSHFTGAYNEAPFVTTYSSHECCASALTMTLFGNTVSYFMKMGSNQISTGNPRTAFAHNIVIATRLGRATAAWAIGLVPFFYSYELLYTYVPGFKIPDASPNGWNNSWRGEESMLNPNTTYLARIASSIFPAIGYGFFFGHTPYILRSFPTFALMNCFYEFCRTCVMPGANKWYYVQSAQDMASVEKWGSLLPNMHHTNDDDSMRPDKATMFRFMRQGMGLMSEELQASQHQDELPMVRSLNLVKNPYFNWQKARQGYNKNPWSQKNDLWELPIVLDARKRSGADDIKPAY